MDTIEVCSIDWNFSPCFEEYKVKQTHKTAHASVALKVDK
jgi:hypothetical protein